MKQPTWRELDAKYYFSKAKDPKFVRRSLGGKKRTVETRLTRAVKAAKRRGEGSIIAYKKVVEGGMKRIAVLRVPVNAAMRCPRNHKCRASRVKVVGIYYYLGDALGDEVYGAIARPYNKFGRATRYVKGQWVKPEYKFDKSNTECASGIHFFLTLQEAVDW